MKKQPIQPFEDMKNNIIKHYRDIWGNNFKHCRWEYGPMKDRFPGFEILVFHPRAGRRLWTYATCGMSSTNITKNVELHLFSLSEYDDIIELLTAIAYYNLNDAKLDLGHSVYFGKPWIDGSLCEYGLVSLPYLDGPSLETLDIEGETVRFYWLIPITKTELEYKKTNGQEYLEKKIEDHNLNYANPNRVSVV